MVLLLLSLMVLLLLSLLYCFETTMRWFHDYVARYASSLFSSVSQASSFFFRCLKLLLSLMLLLLYCFETMMKFREAQPWFLTYVVR